MGDLLGTPNRVAFADDLDEPPQSARATARPPFRLSDLARRLDASAQPSTMPPAPTFELLRDSCRALRLAELALAESAAGWSDADASARDAALPPRR